MIEIIPDFGEFWEDYEKKEGYKYHEGKAEISYKGKYKHLSKDARPTSGIPIIVDINVSLKGQTIIYKYKYRYANDNKDESYFVSSNQNILRHLKSQKHFTCDEDYLKEIIRDYFNFVTAFLNQHKGFIRYNGWRLGGSGADAWAEYITIDDFHGIGSYALFSERNNICPDNIMELFSLLNQYPQLALVFAYGLHSVSKFRFESFESLTAVWNTPEYEDLDRPFSLCLYGSLTSKTEHTKKQIAAALLDYIKPAGYENKFNCRHKPHFSIQYIDRQLKNLLLLGDIPVIITPSGNSKSISTNSKGAKDIEHLQHQGFLKSYPVFISDTAMKRDSILNIDISGISGIDIREITRQVHTLVFGFIHYLEEKPDNTWGMDKNVTSRTRFGIPYLRQLDREAASHFCEEDSNPYLLSYCKDLLTALERFKCFIEEKHNESLKIMDSIIKQAAVLLHDMALDSEKASLLKQSTKGKNLPSPNTYADIFFSTLKEQHKRKPDSIQKSDDDYLVDFDSFCELLPEILTRYAQPLLSYKQVLSQCREMEPPLIKPHYRNKALKIYRELYFKKKEQKVILVPAEIYDKHFAVD